MTTGAFSRNVGKLFSELKWVTDNLLSICEGTVHKLHTCSALKLTLTTIYVTDTWLNIYCET